MSYRDQTAGSTARPYEQLPRLAEGVCSFLVCGEAHGEDAGAQNPAGEYWLQCQREHT